MLPTRVARSVPATGLSPSRAFLHISSQVSSKVTTLVQVTELMLGEAKRHTQGHRRIARAKTPSQSPWPPTRLRVFRRQEMYTQGPAANGQEAPAAGDRVALGPDDGCGREGEGWTSTAARDGGQGLLEGELPITGSTGSGARIPAVARRVSTWGLQISLLGKSRKVWEARIPQPCVQTLP